MAVATSPFDVIELTISTAGTGGAQDLDLSDVARNVRAFTVMSKSNEVLFNHRGVTTSGFPVPANNALPTALGSKFLAGPAIVKIWLPSGATVPDTVFVRLEDA